MGMYVTPTFYYDINNSTLSRFVWPPWSLLDNSPLSFPLFFSFPLLTDINFLPHLIPLSPFNPPQFPFPHVFCAPPSHATSPRTTSPCATSLRTTSPRHLPHHLHTLPHTPSTLLFHSSPLPLLTVSSFVPFVYPLVSSPFDSPHLFLHLFNFP